MLLGVALMTRDDIIDSIKQKQTKNCEGFDRIPQQILIDGTDTLVLPLF